MSKTYKDKRKRSRTDGKPGTFAKRNGLKNRKLAIEDESKGRHTWRVSMEG